MTDPAPPTRRAAAGATLLALLALGCSGGSGGSGSSAPEGGAVVLLHAVPSAALFAFDATVEDVRLVTAGGRRTPDLAPEPVRLPLQDLVDATRWIGAGRVRQDTYVALELTFDAATLEALSEQGLPLTVSSAAPTARLALDPPLVVDSAADETAVATLDLLESLEPLGATMLAFTPSGTARPIAAAAEVGALYGLVRRWDEAAGNVVVDAFADGPRTLALGTLDVRITDKTRVFDLTRTEFVDRDDLFPALRADASVLRLAGRLQTYDALEGYKVDLVDQAAGPTDDVALRGTVLQVDAGAGTFRLLVEEVVAGAELVEPVLAALGDPDSVLCGWDPDSRFYRDLNVDVDVFSLQVGQRATAYLRDLAAEPFPVDDVGLSGDQTVFVGTVSDDAALPATLELELTPDDPRVLAGVLAAGTPLTFDLSGASPELLVPGTPAVAATGLVREHKLVVRADVVGTALFAADVRVHAGQLLEARVSAVDRAANVVTVSSSRLVAGFGPGVDEGPVELLVQPECRVAGAASSVDGLYDLFEGLPSGARLELTVKGVGDPTPGRLRAYELRATVVGG